MGCGCGGGRSYVRPTTMMPRAGSQHAPLTRTTPYGKTVPQAPAPRVVQSSALAQRRAVVRRQV